MSLGAWEKYDVAAVVQYLRGTMRCSTIGILLFIYYYCYIIFTNFNIKGLWGRSMGAVTAILYSMEDPSIASMVLDSPFCSLQKVLIYFIYLFIYIYIYIQLVIYLIEFLLFAINMVWTIIIDCRGFGDEYRYIAEDATIHKIRGQLGNEAYQKYYQKESKVWSQVWLSCLFHLLCIIFN